MQWRCIRKTLSTAVAAGEDELELVVMLEFDFDRHVIMLTGAKFMKEEDAALYSPSMLLDAAEVQCLHSLVKILFLIISMPEAEEDELDTISNLLRTNGHSEKV